MIDPGNSQEQKEVGEVVVVEQLKASEEPQEATDGGKEQAATGEVQDAAAAADAPGKNPERSGKKRIKKVRQVTEEELMPRPSLWPLVLALSVAVALGGFAFNLILLGVGVIMVIVSVIGWSLERR